MSSLNETYLENRKITHNLLQTVHNLGEYQGRYASYEKLTPHLLEKLREIARTESVKASNRLEGITTPLPRFNALMSKGINPANRSEQEIVGYRDVLAMIHTNYEHIPVTPNYILQLHRDLYASTSDSSGGEWKRTDNEIVATQTDGTRYVRFRPTPAWQTPDAMRVLCDNYRRLTEARSIDTLLLIPAFVLDFLCIHPFADGNGRMSRLLTLLLLYKSGYMVGAYISLERNIEAQKIGYYETLEIASQDWHSGKHSDQRWTDYFLSVMLLSAYREFDERVKMVNTTARGGKAQNVKDAIQQLSLRFRFEDVERVCVGVSVPLLRKVLAEMRHEGKLIVGRGANAYYLKTEAYLQSIHVPDERMP
ncbi:MAG: Fic family protein [Armatimonadetes bacterium]|nr:Fic family protein [Armatimonadota bacterium]